MYSSVHSSLRIYIIRVSTVNPYKHVTLLTREKITGGTSDLLLL